MGQSIQEKSIYVSRNDYDKALEILEPFIGNDLGEAEMSELSEQSESDDIEVNKYKIIGRLLGIILLGLPVLMVLSSIIITIIYNIMNR